MLRKNLLAAALLCLALVGCAEPPPQSWLDTMGPEWRENAISYSGYRAGQSPRTGLFPSREQVLEDLRLLERNWSLIRVYATDPHSREVLATIRDEGLSLKVMLGAYFGEEPGAEAQNDRQVRDCIELANAYPDIVVAVNVGNEALIDWSQLPVPEQRMMEFVRRVKDGVSVPVTVADNYVYWRDHGADLAELLDFVTVHTYPIWERKDIDEGLAYTIENIDEVRAALPGKPIVIGEAGWATYTVGNQHVPRAGDEVKQKRYYEQLTAWGREQGIPIFWFSAFDEPWKGTGTEGHWGLFNEQRQPKLAMHALYPERVVEGPTSPTYPEGELRDGPRVDVAFDASIAAAIGGGGVNTAGGWDDVVVVSVSDDAVSGETSLQMRHNGEDWGGMYLILDDTFDLSDYERLVLAVKRSERVAELEVKIESPGGRGAVADLGRFDRRALGDGWIEHSIALESFAGVDLTRLAMIGFWHPRDAQGELIAGEVLVDAIRFE